MKEWFESIPKLVLGPMIIIGGIFYLLLYDPPHTVCNTQYEIFKANSEKQLYGYTKNNLKVPATIVKNFENCRTTNGPGGCLEWMQEMKRLVQEIQQIPTSCGDSIDELDPLSEWMNKSFWLYSHISWNDNPVVRSGILNWLDSEDISIYCRLKNEWIRIKGEEAWKKMQTFYINDLVRTKTIDGKKVDAKEAWERSILSHHCSL